MAAAEATPDSASLLDALPPSLRAAAPVMQRSALAAALKLFARGRRAGPRIHLDEACGMPSDWRNAWRTWNASSRARASGEAKYVADAYIFHMLAGSPFVVSDWQTADASVVVLLPRDFGGAGLAPERCRRKLARESDAWRATGGARHFFILTSDRGPCCNGGQLINTAFLQHHIAGHHGEMEGHHWRHGITPDIACFHAHKDISIPTANTAGPSSRPASSSKARDLLAFYAGSGLFKDSASGAFLPGMREGRRRLHEVWGNATLNPDIHIHRKISPAAYSNGIARAKFCPIMGGFAPWTPRLNEAVLAGCVPVIFSSLLPPFSRVLDWSKFSVRVPSLHDIPRMRVILERQNHAELASRLGAVGHALWYRLEGSYQGDDMLPFLLLEMHLALRAAARRPLATVVPEILGPLPSTPRPTKAWSAPGSNFTFYYEGQTSVRTFHGGVDRAWDCAYLTGGHHPLKAKNNDPQQTYEIGNATQTAPVISAGCVCLRARAMSVEPVSPTQRDMGATACTSPCLQSESVAAFDPLAAWCGADSHKDDGESCDRGSCRPPERTTRNNCTVFGGVAEGPSRKLTRRVHWY